MGETKDTLKMVLTPYNIFPYKTLYVPGDFIKLSECPASFMFFSLPNIIEEKTWITKTQREKGIEHYKKMSEGCFKILNIFDVTYGKRDFGPFYEVIDENGEYEYIPEGLAEFVY